MASNQPFFSQDGLIGTYHPVSETFHFRRGSVSPHPLVESSSGDVEVSRLKSHCNKVCHREREVCIAARWLVLPLRALWDFEVLYWFVTARLSYIELPRWPIKEG